MPSQFAFELRDLPAQVHAVEAVLVNPSGDQGYVMCWLGDDYVTWRFWKTGNRFAYAWGHYFPTRGEALADFVERSGITLSEVPS